MAAGGGGVWLCLSVMRGGDGALVKCWSRQEGGRTRARQLGPTCHCVAQHAIWIIQGQTGGMESNCDHNHNHANRNILMFTLSSSLEVAEVGGGWWWVLTARLTNTWHQMRGWSQTPAWYCAVPTRSRTQPSHRRN